MIYKREETMVIKYLGIFPELFTNQFLKIAVMLLIK